MIEGIFVEGLIYSIMVLGVFITFRILDFPDLTVDGTFPLGAAIAATLIIQGQPIALAMTLAFVGGLLAGMVTAAIHNTLKVPSLLAGILTMIMLWSINLRIMGNRANLPLLKQDTIITHIQRVYGDLAAGTVLPAGDRWALLFCFILIVLLIKVLVDLFFTTDLGLTMGAMGNNEQMIISQGVKPDHVKLIGVGLSNGLVALSGGFFAQYQGFADANLGQGIIITGLASVMIGEFFLRSSRIIILSLRVIVGALVYSAIIYLGRRHGFKLGLTPNDLQLISGVLIIAAIAFTRFAPRKRKRRERPIAEAAP